MSTIYKPITPAKVLLFVIFLVGLIYLLLPGFKSIDNFPPLASSIKSKLTGDTIQNPNISAYFSDFRREGITKLYKDIFSKSLISGISLPFVIINHPPEEAYIYVRDQQESSFLEEYVYPLRESIFVNGYDPKMENDMINKKDRSFVGDHLFYDETYFNTKTTLRYYPTNVLARVFVYAAIWGSFFGLLILFKKALKEI